MKFRLFTPFRFLLCALAFFAILPSGRAQNLPNALVIVTDDQRFDDLDDYMPFTKRELFDKGLRFTKGYVTTPACCPSRATIFTGRYASEHKVSGNRFVLEEPTVAERVAKAGTHYLGLIGKYLNTSDGNPRPEFDYWVSFAGGSSRFRHPILNVNGVWQRKEGYITNIFRDSALEFFGEAHRSEKPFLCYLNFNAPHAPATPHASDRRAHVPLQRKRPPSFQERDLSDKPEWLRRRKRPTPGMIKNKDKFRQRARRTLFAVDRAVQAIFERLEELGQLNNTAIFFISDNGVMDGEHGLYSKDTVYEEAIRVPFALYYPSIVPPSESDALVANLDIAPTLYELAGIDVPENVSGRSLLGLLQRPEEWRSELLIEGFRRIGPRTMFSAVHTGRYVYVRNGNEFPGPDRNREELYDLDVDPYQLHNKVHEGEYTIIREDLSSRLNDLLDAHRGYRSLDRPAGSKLPYKFSPPDVKRTRR
jgi:N-acetylglucosamine-6-sulfatase